MRWDAEKYDEVKIPQVDAGNELITLAKVRDTDSILDIGCGTGKLTVALARLAYNGFVTGLDPSHEMLEKAGTISGDLPNIRLRVPETLRVCSEVRKHFLSRTKL